MILAIWDRLAILGWIRTDLTLPSDWFLWFRYFVDFLLVLVKCVLNIAYCKEYTKPRNITQNPKKSTRVAANVNNRYVTYNIRYSISRITYIDKKVLIFIKRY